MYNGFHFYEGFNKEHGHLKVIVKARSKRAANKILLDKYSKGWHILIYCWFKENGIMKETDVIKKINSANELGEFDTKYIYLKQGD